MITRTLFASLGAAALLASPMVASASTTTKSTTTSSMAPAKKALGKMAATSSCKGMTGKQLNDCKVKYEVKKTTTTPPTHG